MKIRIKNIIPFGSQCFSAFFVKSINLKKESYPFDWIFSSPLMIKDILDDNFAKFLYKDNYIIKDPNEKINKHKIYLPELNLFNHRNPIKDEDYIYYIRCINRFNNILQTSEKKLFLLTSLRNNFYNELNNLFILRNKLSELTTNYIFVCIFQESDGSNIQHKDLYYYDNLIVVQINTLEYSDGVLFSNESDNIFYKNIIDDLFTFY